MTKLSMRPGLSSDIENIVRCHIDIWRQTYSHLVAPDIAAALTDSGRRTERWRELLADQGATRKVIVAERDTVLVGFGMFGRGDPDIFGDAGEIKYLYVALAQHGQGIGRALFSAMASGLRHAGSAAVALGVVRGNAPAIAFYERIGGRHVGDFTDPGPMWRSDNLIYRWDDIEAAIAVGDQAAGR